MPIYKNGKQTQVMHFAEVKQKVAEAELTRSEEAYFWLLYWCGVRKSEAYERIAEDFKITDSHLIAGFARKKGSEKVPPLEIPLHYFGVDKIVAEVKRARQSKPKIKRLFISEDKKRVGKQFRGKWVFPHIQSTKAWQIVRKILGQGYYPHFLRLNRLTIIGADPSTSFIRLKTFSGIKSVKSLSAYLGQDKKEQRKAMEISGREAEQD